MKLPAPAAKYDPSDESQTRRALEQELERLADQVQTLERRFTVITAISATGNVTVPAQRDPNQGYLLVIDIKNTTVGVITVTLDVSFLGVFTPPAAGKRSSRMYWYDRSIAKWAPVGAQSPDL